MGTQGNVLDTETANGLACVARLAFGGCWSKPGVRWSDAHVGDDEAVRDIVSRCLMLDWDYTEAFRVAQRLSSPVTQILERGGGRFLRGATLFEDFCKTVCTINTSWGNTVRVVGALVSEVGKGVFPSPPQVTSTDEAELKRCTKAGYRIRTLQEGAVRFFLRGDSSTVRGLSIDDLLSVHGIGGYAADHMRVLQGDYSRIPVDSEVLSYCRKELGLDGGGGSTEVNNHFEEWGTYRFLGYKLGRIARKSNWIGD